MHTKIENLVENLRLITAETETTADILEKVRPLIVELAKKPDWVLPEYRKCNEEQGFGVHLLHEEEDHSLAVLMAAWLPGFGIPPHNHGTWSVIAGIEGTERNTMWEIAEKDESRGYAKIRESGRVDIGPGDVLASDESAIHSVSNDGEETTLSLHVYGKNINHTVRHGFNPVEDTFARLTVKIE
ncbi:MAG: hypothetical protein R3D45_09870 [Rhizobiaceae bacterium]